MPRSQWANMQVRRALLGRRAELTLRASNVDQPEYEEPRTRATAITTPTQQAISAQYARRRSAAQAALDPCRGRQVFSPSRHEESAELHLPDKFPHLANSLPFLTVLMKA